MPEKEKARSKLAGRLRDARKLAGLSQAQVAELMGLHRPTVSEIEAGRRRVVSEELVHFAELYGVSTTWLLGDEDQGVSLHALVAARELERMKPEDLERLLEIITAVREGPRVGGD